MGHKPDRKARKKRRETEASRLRALADQPSQEALKNVDAWEKACRRSMNDAAKGRSTSTEVNVHSVEVRAYRESQEAFEDEFRPAAEALKKKLEADGSVKARYAFRQTEAQTIDGGMEQSWRDVRTFPTCREITFKITW